jgi:hypothetical protein
VTSDVEKSPVVSDWQQSKGKLSNWAVSGRHENAPHNLTKCYLLRSPAIQRHFSTSLVTYDWLVVRNDLEEVTGYVKVKVLSHRLLEWVEDSYEKNSVIMAGLRKEIRNHDHPNNKQECQPH